MKFKFVVLASVLSLVIIIFGNQILFSLVLKFSPRFPWLETVRFLHLVLLVFVLIFYSTIHLIVRLCFIKTNITKTQKLKTVACIYITIIACFACCYFFINEFYYYHIESEILPFYGLKDNLGWFNFLHYSIITITSVGYGDIYPNDNLAVILSDFEAIIGQAIVVIAIGMVFSEWYKYQPKNTKRRKVSDHVLITSKRYKIRQRKS